MSRSRLLPVSFGLRGVSGGHIFQIIAIGRPRDVSSGLLELLLSRDGVVDAEFDHDLNCGAWGERRQVAPLWVVGAVAVDSDAEFPEGEVGVAGEEGVEVAGADGAVEGVFPVVFAVTDSVFGVGVVAQADEAAGAFGVEGAVGGDAEASVFSWIDGGDEKIFALDGDDFGVEVYGAEFEPPVFAGDVEDFMVGFGGEEFGEAGHGGLELLPVGAVVLGA